MGESGSVESFFDMGGYAAYVWPSYLLTALVMIILLVSTLGRLRRLQQRLQRLDAAGTRRRPATAAGVERPDEA